jgi:hypothetical protein
VASQTAVWARSRFDGSLPISGNLEIPLIPSQVRDLVAFIKSVRTCDATFKVVQSGTTGEDAEQSCKNVAPYEAAGAIWWFESRVLWRTSLESDRLN